MQFERLRINGFKSFVDPAEVELRPGLTGIVGPNGCGKSNLVEALRWAMGETSPKRVRGGAMDDVIFAGSQTRPARNMAEVVLGIDNASRSAPAGFNDDDVLEVSRRIEREAGSTYRLNGREVRARDIQLLFADAASGAHSPALVSQGRIAALISAKPTDRRALLDEAAGITGLHSRRHEAELRLNAAEQNMGRLDDVMSALETQWQGLKRQLRQANRYRKLGEEIRRFDAIRLHLQHAAAGQALARAEAALRAQDQAVGARTAAAATAQAAEAEAEQALPPLRQADNERAAALHRLQVERDGLERERERALELSAQLEARMRELGDAIERELGLAGDAEAAVGDLAREAEALSVAQAGEAAAAASAQARLDDSQGLVDGLESEVAALTQQIADASARRQAAERERDAAAERLERLARAIADAARDEAELRAAHDDDAGIEDARAQLAQAVGDLDRARASHAGAGAQTRETATARQAALESWREADRDLATLNAELEALARLLGNDAGELWTPLIDAVTVEPGYEIALGAALGDDLQAPDDTGAPVHWKTLPPLTDAPSLPAAARAMSELVRAPEPLRRRLAQIGLVDAADGERLVPRLAQGQRLVSREGDLWRWDGLTMKAGADSAAAARLEQRNRLAALQDRRAGLERRAAETGEALERASESQRGADDAVAEALAAANEAEDARRAADGRLHDLERAAAARDARLLALRETLARLGADREDVLARAETAAESLANQAPLDQARERLAGQRHELGRARGDLAAARGQRDELAREAARRADRLAAIANESATWRRRADAGRAQVERLTAQRESVARDLGKAHARPSAIAAQRDSLDGLIETATLARRTAANELAAAEDALAGTRRARREAEQALAAAREERVRREAEQSQARDSLARLVREIAETLDCRPPDILSRAGIEADDDLPAIAEAEARLIRLRRERDGMGPVNLRAEAEAAELREQLDTMESERADLEQAISRLRQGIASLDREGKERLLAAFKAVDAHFRDLFVRLFGGGQAELALSEADDLLDAGLEVMASPPGKRMQRLSLLSGGEQALTALALLFAVFLTNPAPICVLDEVDAPLDDANVERFSNLVSEIAQRTGTRFLIVTHHPYTMARMDRLFGVTMSEEGVSQLVSVDLERAERLLASA